MYKIVNIARYFISKNNKYTDKQIQKLVYYAYCWYIVKNNTSENEINKKLFNERPEAWIHGPAFKSLYNEMKYNRKKFDKNDNYLKLDDDIKSLLDLIYNVYGDKSGNKLELLTHNEAPWKEARKGLNPDEHSNERLEDRLIYEYYSN